MKTYIGKKTVQAERMNELQAVELGYARRNEDNHEWREGYHVVYEDGYHSWSPLNVFESSYKIADEYLDRLYIETEELAEKHSLLMKYMSTPMFAGLEHEEQKLMEAQFASMLSYLTILQLRIKRAEKLLGSSSTSKEPYRANDINAERCGDNRFEVIAKAKESILKSTNIESSPDEMDVLDNILFRCWQMGWLKQYESEWQ